MGTDEDQQAPKTLTLPGMDSPDGPPRESVQSIQHFESAPPGVPLIAQDDDSSSSSGEFDAKLPNEPENGKDALQAVPRPSVERRASSASGLSASSRPSLFSIPDSDTHIAYTFEVVAFGSASLQVAEQVVDDPLALIVHVKMKAAEGYAQMNVTPVVGFSTDIPDDIFNRLVTTAFVFVLEVDSEPGEWDNSMAEARRRHNEVKARVRMSHHSRGGGAGQRKTVWMPIMVCLFVTQKHAADIDTDMLKLAQTWASENGIEVLSGGAPVRLSKGPLRDVFAELANDRLACNPGLDAYLSQDLESCATVSDGGLLRSLRRSCRRCCGGSQNKY